MGKVLLPQQSAALLTVGPHDHWFGQHNDPLTSPIPANDHRVLSELQAQWPEKTLRNPDGSPLLRIAAGLRGWLDVLRLLIERVAGWIPAALEQLDELLH